MIFILIIIGIVLVVINVRAVKEEGKSFGSTYREAKDNITDYEIEIGKLRNEFAETLLEIQVELEEVKRKIDHYEKRNSLFDKETYKISENNDERYIEDDEKQHSTEDKPVNSNSIKIEKVNKMLGEGLTVDEVAAELQLGKGEVLLIKDLYLK